MPDRWRGGLDDARRPGPCHPDADRSLGQRGMRNHVLPALGDLRAREITVVRIERFLRACELRLQPNTVRSVRTVVSGVLGHASRLGAIRSNPTRDAGPIEGQKKEIRALTADERNELMAKLDVDDLAESHDIPDLVAFLLGTGCRIGEAIAAEAAAVDLDAQTITINANIVRVRGVGLVRHRGKTFSARRVLPLPTFLVELFDARGVRDAAPDALLFPNTEGGWRDPHNTGARLRGAVRRAGFGWVTSHVFRKTAITVLDQAGLTARAIAATAATPGPRLRRMSTWTGERTGGRPQTHSIPPCVSCVLDFGTSRGWRRS